MNIKELKQKFDNACTELANDAQTVVEIHFFITAYMKMFNEYPNIISLDTEGFYLNPKGNEDFDDDENDDYKEIEDHRFNSLKKAIKWWNEYFGEDDDGRIHYAE